MMNADPEPGSLSSERLALLYQLSQTFNASLDLDEVLNRVMDEVIAATKAERGFVMLTGEKGELSFRAARGIDHSSIDDPEFQISRSIVSRVAVEGQPVLTSDAQVDERFSKRQSVMSLGLRSILCAPLLHKDNVAGVIYVDNRLQAGIFSHDDLAMLSAIAFSAAVAIENARLYQIAVEKGRMERELQMARQVQRSLLPAHIPDLKNWSFAARWHPAREVAGDYYDFIHLDGGRVALLLGDVTDKGLPASLFMVFARSAVRTSVDGRSTIGAAIERANRLICEESTQGLFVTLFCGLLDSESGRFRYVNAGHNPALYVQVGLNGITPLVRTGMPLGIDAGIGYEEVEITMEPGDFVLMYTDGVTEALSPGGEEFGMERLESVVSEHRHASASELLTALEQAVEEFTAGTQPSDDITLLLVKRH